MKWVDDGGRSLRPSLRKWIQDGASIVHSFIEEVKKSPHRPLILCPLSLSLSQSLYISVYIGEVEVVVKVEIEVKVEVGIGIGTVIEV